MSADADKLKTIQKAIEKMEQVVNETKQIENDSRNLAAEVAELRKKTDQLRADIRGLKSRMSEVIPVSFFPTEGLPLKRSRADIVD